MRDVERHRDDVAAQCEVRAGLPNFGDGLPTATHHGETQAAKEIFAFSCPGNDGRFKSLLSVARQDRLGRRGERAVDIPAGKVAGARMSCSPVRSSAFFRVVGLACNTRCHGHLDDRRPVMRRKRGFSALGTGSTCRGEGLISGDAVGGVCLLHDGRQREHGMFCEYSQTEYSNKRGKLALPPEEKEVGRQRKLAAVTGNWVPRQL